MPRGDAPAAGVPAGSPRSRPSRQTPIPGGLAPWRAPDPVGLNGRSPISSGPAQFTPSSPQVASKADPTSGAVALPAPGRLAGSIGAIVPGTRHGRGGL